MGRVSGPYYAHLTGKLSCTLTGAHWRIQGGGAVGAKAPPPIPHSTGATIEISPPPISAKASAENGQYLDEKRREEDEQFLLFRGFKKQNFAPAVQQHFYPHDVN